MQLKKVVNHYKFKRVKDNPNSYRCCVHVILSQEWRETRLRTGYLLGDHLYIVKESGVFPHGRFEYYCYFVGEIGAVHYRKDNIMFFKVRTQNPF